MGPIIAAGGTLFDPAITILLAILAIVAVVLAFVFLVPEKKQARLNAFGKFVHKTLNFKYLIIEKILQALYIFFTAYVILEGVFFLFTVTGDKWWGLEGLLEIVLGPIAVRLAFEASMLIILLIKNVIQINNKLKNQNEGAAADPFAAAPQMPFGAGAPAAPTAPVCQNCGAPLGDGPFCPDCGAPRQ